jgi:hypothetical protein
VSKVITIAPLAFEAGILAAIVTGIAGRQGADRGTWLEHNPLVFGLAVGLAVFVVGLLMVMASSSGRRS